MGMDLVRCYQKRKIKHSVLIIIQLFTFTLVSGILPPGSIPAAGGPTVKRLLTMEKCEVNGDAPYDADIYLTGLGPSLACSGHFNFREDVTDEFIIKATFEKWVNGQWVIVSKLEKGIWSLIESYGLESYQRFAHSVEPNLPDEFPMPAGEYTLKDFWIPKEEVDIPTLVRGRLRVTFRVDDSNGDEIYCTVMDFDVVDETK